MHTRAVRAIVVTLVAAIAVFALVWAKLFTMGASRDAQIRAVREAYDDREIDRQQARKMLGELGEIVDRWPSPPDPESLSARPTEALRANR